MTKGTPDRDRSCLGRIMRWVLIALAFFIGGGVLAQLRSGGDDAPSAGDTVRVQATEAVLLLPTVTPQPTATTPAANQAEIAYVDALSPLFGVYGESLSLIGTQLTNAGSNLLLLDNETWILQTATAIVVVQTANEELRSLLPPPLFVDAHADLLAMAYHLDTAMTLLMDGIDARDADKVVRAQQEMTAAAVAMDQAQRKLVALAGDR